MTPLEKTLKRQLAIEGVEYVITLSPLSLKITVKNHRLGVELAWKELISGESALAVALQASVGKFVQERGGHGNRGEASDNAAGAIPMPNAVAKAKTRPRQKSKGKTSKRRGGR